MENLEKFWSLEGSIVVTVVIIATLIVYVICLMVVCIKCLLVPNNDVNLLPRFTPFTISRNLALREEQLSVRFSRGTEQMQIIPEYLYEQETAPTTQDRINN